MPYASDAADGSPTAFGTLHPRVRSADGAAVLVEVLHPPSGPEPYDRLLAARDALRAVQGRHVLEVLDVVRQQAGDGTQLCAVVRPGFPYAALTGPLPAPEAVQVVGDVLRALADVHAAGQVHGALDARAVLLDVSLPLRPTVRVLDHGLAALLTDRDPTPADDMTAAAELLRSLLPDAGAWPAALAAALEELPELPAAAAAVRLGSLHGLTSRPGRRLRRDAAPPPAPVEPADVVPGWVPPPP